MSRYPDITSCVFPDPCRPLNFIGNFFGCQYNRNFLGCGVVLINIIGGNPDILIDPKFFLECAVSDFVNCGCLPYAKKDDIFNVTRRLNGGTTGLAEREFWFSKWKNALGV